MLAKFANISLLDRHLLGDLIESVSSGEKTSLGVRILRAKESELKFLSKAKQNSSEQSDKGKSKKQRKLFDDPSSDDEKSSISDTNSKR